ncbi:VOC family protein [Mammaliicoccus stepanovicii]|uniref:VOC family protein n=1 Tax=Mammaliicoccus stepanovicii TaxID=643214 RepID=UPI000BA462A2|nr:VOC family protein [Mammaliicoccus stepanovicii]PNZ76916.1 glyoxalase/bleomycin resistance/extradiol dioxygenase family protein [Mammaliicoccus stepanovicii]
MEKLQQVMLYVDDQDKAVKFWTEVLDFIVVGESELPEGYKVVEVAPNKEAQTSFAIFDKEFIKKYSPEVSLETPSLMFKATNFDELYNKLKEANLTGHDIVEMPEGRVVNFHDTQGNYFAIME